MKRKLGFILSVFMFFTFALSDKVSAVEISRSVEHFPNGEWRETVIEEIRNQRNRSIITGTKRVSYYNNDTLLWYVEVQGEFRYDGVSSSATNNWVKAESHAQTWKITSRTSTRNRNTATARATAKRSYVGVVIQTIEREVSITCNAQGVLS